MSFTERTETTDLAEEEAATTGRLLVVTQGAELEADCSCTTEKIKSAVNRELIVLEVPVVLSLVGGGTIKVTTTNVLSLVFAAADERAKKTNTAVSFSTSEASISESGDGISKTRTGGTKTSGGTKRMPCGI